MLIYIPLILTFSLKGEGTKPLNLTALGQIPNPIFVHIAYLFQFFERNALSRLLT
jgi:hypothetical protein